MWPFFKKKHSIWSPWSEPEQVVVDDRGGCGGRYAVVQLRKDLKTGEFEYRELKGLRGLPASFEAKKKEGK